MSENWQKIKDLFALAEELPPARREDFLREHCGDPETYDEVKSLLDASEATHQLIEDHALSPERLFPAVKNYDSTKFGHYTVLREIGRGGMGAVFLAERNDGEFEQKVALKIIRQGFANDGIERYFRRERQILASLNHPNIARLVDGGVSETGELFLAMEYVEGLDLIEYCRRGDSDVETLLRLFLKVCRAVSFAHQNLIVHRDLKPSNIIVDGAGEPKLLDFGLAKDLGFDPADAPFRSDPTRTDFRAFTPAYASPEQITGRNITTASDVYSLGVIFYELLSGAKPFDFEGKSLEEIIKTITGSEPAQPSAVASGKSPDRDKPGRRLNSDLDNIALKALQKDSANRYKSVEEFAADIERHLNGLPVSARPATVFYRASKFFGRNKIAASGTIVVIVALAAGLSVALWQANAARRERDRAQQRFNDVRKLSNALLSEIAPKLENLPGSTEAREAVVKNALEYLDRLATEAGDDAVLRTELATAYEKIGDLQGNPNKPNLSDFAGAIESYRKANLIRRALPESVENLSLLAKNRLQSSAVRYVQSDFQGALDDSDESLRIYENLAGRGDSPEIGDDYLEARIDNAQIYADNNQYKTAIPLFEKILAALERSDRRPLRRLRVKAATYYANALSWDDRQTEAETVLKEAVADAEKLFADFPADSVIRKQLWRTYSIASSIFENVDNPTAYDFARKSVAIAETEVAADNADTQAKQNLAKSYSRLGNDAVLLGRLGEAVEDLRKSESISRELLEKEPKNVAYLKDFGRLYIRFGDLYRRLGDLPKALENYEKSVSSFQRIADRDEKLTLARRDVAQSMKNVGEIQLKLDRRPEARQTFERALLILTDLQSKNALGEFDRKMITELQKELQK